MKAAFRQCRILKTDIQETTLALACQAIVDQALAQRACAASNLTSHRSSCQHGRLHF
ncbi:MAG: hypothetical protein U5L01_10270 [Rheinheimera sp.]|nr:hypothetical protein [Rheinheimera sp.]